MCSPLANITFAFASTHITNLSGATFVAPDKFLKIVTYKFLPKAFYVCPPYGGIIL